MIRTLPILLLFMACYGTAVSQTDQHHPSAAKASRHHQIRPGFCPIAYLGVSTGINNNVGILGPQIDVAFSPSFSIGTGLGLSTWGTKIYAEGRLYFSPCHQGWAIGAGITHNTGGHDLPLKDQETVAGKADIQVNLDPISNFILSGYYFFPMGRTSRNRLHLQAGFSIPLNQRNFVQTAGPEITQKTNDAINALAPGGLVLGIGFSFGMGNSTANQNKGQPEKNQ